MPNPEYFVVDRLEGATAVVVGDNGRSYDVPRDQLPAGSHEGTVLRLAPVGSRPDWSTAIIDAAERTRREREARQTLDELRKRDPGGDIQL